MGNNSRRKDIWMRMERVPKFPRRAQSHLFPANDIYSLSYDYGVMLKQENSSIKAIACLSQLPGLSLAHIVELTSIIRNVCGEWEQLDTNSRWFCAVTLGALKRRFNGIWMMGEPRDGLLDFYGAQSHPAQIVWDQSNSTNQGFHEVRLIDGKKAARAGLSAPSSPECGIQSQKKTNTSMVVPTGMQHTPNDELGPDDAPELGPVPSKGTDYFSKLESIRNANKSKAVTTLTPMSILKNAFTSTFDGKNPAPAVQRGTMGLQNL
ncbi:unnamed protein product [Rhizoctonia solani]|uniref:Uncharacterized protein n=2 Tax=Rhizoctonia solani TaxID=456999 RepID=A0A8H3H8I9_9AGAM|nr:unnamed protein product [Rhizoctonia solani]